MPPPLIEQMQHQPFESLSESPVPRASISYGGRLERFFTVRSNRNSPARIAAPFTPSSPAKTPRSEVHRKMTGNPQPPCQGQ